MAEGIITPVVANLLSKLSCTALQAIAPICCVEELFKLKDTFSVIHSVLLDAEQKGVLNLAVKDWLGKLKGAADDAEDLLDELSYETLRREAIWMNKTSKKVRILFSDIKKLRHRLDLIAADRKQFNFVETMDSGYAYFLTRREYSHSFVREEEVEVIGRDEEKEEIVKRLLEINEKQNVSVDAIVGIGGLGKTVLAQSVFNHKRVEDAFDLRLWVCISESFDLEIIVEKIIEAATGQRPSELEMESQSKLRKQIDGKKYLLVMDDLWNEDGERWAQLKGLLMGGAKGSKILITTRSKLVAEVSEATSPYILKGLSESNSWILFKKMAFEECEELESPNKIEIGRDVARKCMGVPLAIRTIGRLLYYKTWEAEWLSFKNNELSTITQQEEEIIWGLKLSYNHLPSHLKSCFAYCSLFPKGHEFEKGELINLWVAEGFVQSQGENECLEDVGNDYFMQLIRRYMFQDVKRNDDDDVVRCKMHDLMHDLARFAAGTECFTPDSDIKNVNERTQRVSFDCGGVSKWPALFTSQLKSYKLRTFLSLTQVGDYGLSYEQLEAHILSLKSLRVLNLQQLGMREIPFSIGILKHLRFLNLSGNRLIQSLPSSVTELHFLQTLNLNKCSLLELPKDIGSLINLRYLDLSDNKSIKRLPDSTSKLLHLQKLILNNCTSLIELPEDIGSLVNLRHLDLSDNKSIKRLPDSTSKLMHLQKLILNDCTSLMELPENIGNMVGLRFLHLGGNDRIKLLPNSIVNLQKLQLLNLRGCESLRELPKDVSNLVNLKHLDLDGCVGLRGMPLGLNKLTGLQKMNLYAMGPSVFSEEGGLWQLNTLTKIRGMLRIRGLHHLRKDSSQADTVNLKNNLRVRDLILEWSKIGDNQIESGQFDLSKMLQHWTVLHNDFVVLEKLRPNENIETLRIDGYDGVRLSSWVSSLSNLTFISIVDCERLQNIPRFDRLPNLQCLWLRNLNLIEYMDDNMEEFDSSVFFPSLQSLLLWNMGKLKGWWKSREFTPKDPGQSFLLPSFRCLSYLHTSDCPQMFSSPFPKSSFKTLHLSYSIASPEDYTQRGVLDSLDDLHSLCIECCYDLIRLPDWIGKLCALQSLEIKDCPKLRLLPEGICRLSSLRSLTIHGCKRLEERYTPQIGEDWSKIAHVKDIKIGR